MLYGLAILLAGIFSTEPFIEGVPSRQAGAAALALCHVGGGDADAGDAALRADRCASVRAALVHWIALALITLVSFLFGTSPAIGGTTAAPAVAGGLRLAGVSRDGRNSETFRRHCAIMEPNMFTLPPVESLIARLAALGIALPPGPVQVDGYGDSPSSQKSCSPSSVAARRRPGPVCFGLTRQMPRRFPRRVRSRSSSITTTNPRRNSHHQGGNRPLL